MRSALACMLVAACSTGVAESEPRPTPAPAAPAAPAPPAPPAAPGKWLTTTNLDYRGLPTMEMVITKNIHGAAWIELAADGTATGCVGSVDHEGGSISHYQASDHKDHSNQETYYQLVALRGHWKAGGSGVDLAFDSASWNSCTPSAQTFDPRLAVHCAFGDSRLQVPAGMDTLVCRAAPGDAFSRLGFAFEAKRMGPIADAPVGEWFVLGRDPGVTVAISLGAHDVVNVAISRGAGPLVEKQFLEPPKRPAH